MFPAPFEYHRAVDVDEALELLAEHADREVKLLSGGHSLLPTMKSGLATPDVIVDIGHVDALTGIEEDDEAATTTFGALTTYAEIAGSDDARRTSPAVAEAAGEVGDMQVRNRGTIGGNIAHSDPASDLPAAVLASNGTIHAVGPDGERKIAADDFFTGMFMTALEEDEILTGIELPSLRANDVGVYVKRASPSSGYAVVGVAVVLRTNGETVESARVAVNGAFECAVRLHPVEEALTGARLDSEPVLTAAEKILEDVETFEFLHDRQASSEFREHLLEVYTERALSEAIERLA